MKSEIRYGRKLLMATNLAIDPDLLERAVAMSGECTKTAAVKRALEEFIARREQGKLVELFGALEWDPRYDYKAARSRRCRSASNVPI
jgi:hypothetical protein